MASSACGRTLIVNLPGSPKGAAESLEALVPVLDHALETLAGPYDHGEEASQLMFETFAEVPAYPLVFPVFWGAAAFFALAMARHLRIFAVALQSHPFANVPVRIGGLVEYAVVQTKMFKDVKAGVMHSGIFWGFDAPDHRHGQHRDRRPHPVDPLDPLRWRAVDRGHAMQNVVAVIVLVSIAWASSCAG